MAVNFLNLERHTNNFRKGIQQDHFDEPTYLTFSLEFDLDSPMQDSSNFLNSSPLFNTKDGSSQSAINYLLSRGHDDKANQISVFNNILKYLRDDTPWYFQSITGLEKLWGDATKMEAPMKTTEATITVKTLEAVDLRITELADLYRNSVYDKQYMRERVPDNLRWFSMDIYVAEFRNLRNTLPSLISTPFNVGVPTFGGLLGTKSSSDVGNILDNFGYVKFKCRQCEFDFSKSFAGGSDITIGGDGVKQAANTFDIKIGWMEEENSYSSGSKTYDNYTSGSIRGNAWNGKGFNNGIGDAATFLTGLPVVGNTFGSVGAKAAARIESVLNTPNKIINQGIAELQQLVEQGRLGQASVYGYESNDDIIPNNTATPKTNGQ
tara:strand:- start:592 stop:1728 length:1137 start_codon:yes stop_codon:yes gene_type:complete